MAARPEPGIDPSILPLAERIELLRLAGARHRLAFAVAVHDLRREAGRFRAARVAWSLGKAILGARLGRSPIVHELSPRSRLLAGAARLLLSVGSGPGGPAYWRGLIRAGSLGLLLFGLARRLVRRRRA